MSFFKKLKSKLFRSSSKIEEGLDAIVDNEEQVEDNISLNDEDITGQETEIG
ncbi:signal recognition particle-docking protein FtsY, partial [Amylibacter sp.]|nr:signal recognition particle-docking protein FtsY [Amylibacter sp.]